MVTGAAGFLGRRLVSALLGRARVVAVDLLPRVQAYVPEHQNLEWFQMDLADAEGVAETFRQVRAGGPLDAVVHLAAYYDFTGEPNPEYQHANVDALGILLAACRPLNLRRFVYASSIGVCRVTRARAPITEETPPGGDHYYAVTKSRGEELVRAAAAEIPSVIVRLAALYSDWCEYPPVHSFLETWLSGHWNARVLGGRGETSSSYLHVRDGVSFFLKVLEQMDELTSAEVLIAGEDGSVSHRQLFEAATEYHFGRSRRPRFVPAWLAGPGMAFYDIVGRLTGERPFERPWMARYIDTHLAVDASRTRHRLRWQPHPRLAILNRVPFMIENRRTDPVEWMRRNREALEHRTLRPHYQVYRIAHRREAEIAEAFRLIFEGPTADPFLRRYQTLDEKDRSYQRQQLVRNLIEAIRTGAKGPFMAYCRDLARLRLGQGFPAGEVLHALRSLQRLCQEIVRRDPESAGLNRALHDYLDTTLDFGVDQLLEVYEESETGSLPARRLSS
jgi:nucleoside-diphosphate-sugar epimerase